MFPPSRPLPFDDCFSNADIYVSALLEFITTSGTLQRLCGGVHILDFLTREPDLYEAVLPPDWRAWLDRLDMADVLDFLMREDMSPFARYHNAWHTPLQGQEAAEYGWRGAPLPPVTLLGYVETVRKLSLQRRFTCQQELGPKPPAALTVGMNGKKLHEVERFASYVDALATYVSRQPAHHVTHLVDFGSGQNYLGRVLASEPYKRRVVAVERKPTNVDAAKRRDVSARLLKKEVVWRDKKAFRLTGRNDAEALRRQQDEKHMKLRNELGLASDPRATDSPASDDRIQYVEQSLSDGSLEHLVNNLAPWSHPGFRNGHISGDSNYLKTLEGSSPTERSAQDTKEEGSPSLLVISLHSCGNLVHHGLRALTANPSVKGVALVGCCYNLCTERLGPPTYKLPNLRSPNKRLDETSSAADPHGFPMSRRFTDHQHGTDKGIRFNITARMMAVQAPQNWTRTEYESFFTRHFYRALLQRLFLDRGLIKLPEHDPECPSRSSAAGSGGEPIIVGSLRKSCYTSFVAYVRGALTKLAGDADLGQRLQFCMSGLTDAEIVALEERYRGRRHHLCILWSLMAFSAGLIESAIVIDRWLYLREQADIADAWVQTVFDYEKSPRNLVVVGIKD